ncbi:MAG: chromosome segregation protein SMC [Deltaproteobacteria bacterium]|nr:chromosome segregation protein SMC [Deltaproteobacteria bacterium]
MKLKKLELFGFKSFYDKTVFDFSDGITAIVGPNGCGKSNIVDAIRWVLGEHAPSYLRSKALEDVIFAGSDAAGPLGMAEVTLTFTNEDGFAPPGYESYAEIQVTRRTFRNGESEFFTNRVPCRLKDIAELFLDTGAGARGYAIIEQGKIMTIVNARPDEKRLIIEEAAGVAKFRVRRKEAERKMENTRQNLARVKDVLDEVKRQLGSLDRQARKAERYKGLKDELRGLDLRIAARRFRDLTRERDSAGAELARAEESLLAVRTEISRLEAERESGRLRHAELDAALRDLREAHGSLKEESARRQEEWKGNVKEASLLRDTIAEVSGEIASLENEITELSARIAEAEEAAGVRQDGIAAAASLLAELAARAEAAKEDYLRRQGEVEQAKDDLIVRVSLHSNARVSVESYRRMMEDQERNLERRGEKIEEGRAAAEKAERDLADAFSLEAAARESLTAAERSWEETGALLAEAIARLDGVVEARRNAEGLLHASSSRLSTLSRLYEQRDWATSGVRAVLRHYNGHDDGTRDGGDKGIFGVIGDLVETDAPYEKAVEAVLGERMQSIVVRDHAEGLSALQYLKESREGRGSFVPVTLRTRDDAPAYAGEEGVIAPLAEIVRVPSECRDLLRGLLGGTLLVRDMECALRLWNRNGVWNTYVTLDGDVVTAEGTLVGGAKEEGEFGILAVKREIRELEKEIAVRSAEAARLKDEEEKVRQARAALEGRKEEMFRRREEALNACGQAEQQRAVLEAAQAQAQSSFEGLMQEREYLQSELARMKDESRASQEAALQSEQARGEEEERVRQLAAALEVKRAAKDEAVTASHAAELALAGLKGVDASEQAVRAGLIETLSGRQALIEDRRRREETYEERNVALAETIAAGRGAIEAAAGELSRLQERIDCLLEEAADAAGTLGSQEDMLKESRRREWEEVERISNIRLSVQRVESDLGILDSLTWQRYEAHPADLPAPPAEAADPDAEAAETAGWASRAEEIRSRLSAIGDVNLASIEEYRELSGRHDFLSAQKEDLEKSLDDLAKAIQRINRTTRERFSDAFEKINEKLAIVFPKLFLGGRAFLTLIEEENLLETGVELVVQLPGKKVLPLKSLSGGEKSLAAAAMIFSIFLVKPSPFCLLDEADTALDDANIDRFNALIREMSSSYQFLLITHNKRTMELADALYGVTMEKPGISRVVSVQFQA